MRASAIERGEAAGRQTQERTSEAWLTSLRARGRDHDEAVAALHALLLKAARFEVGRRRAGLPHLRGSELEDIAAQSADDALVAVLSKLDGFRGDSRFTTWAYKFALLEAAVALRRRSWQARELPLTDEGWSVIADARAAAAPARAAIVSETLDAIRDAIARDLTPHQRDVLVAITLNDVPIDVLADRLATTRGALYKTLHDARRKLRLALAAQGMRDDLVGGDPR